MNDIKPDLEKVAVFVEISEKEPYRSDSLDTVSYFDDEPVLKAPVYKRAMASYSVFDDDRNKRKRSHNYNEFDRMWSGK